MNGNQTATPPAAEPSAVEPRCDLLRSLHVPGSPLVLPNAWDVASARQVAAAGFPVVATTSGGVAATLGYEDHEGAPSLEMLAAAARICEGVEVPVTVDAEAGYGMEPAALVTILKCMGAAGCNLEDTDHREEVPVKADRQARWLRGVREAASEQGYGLVINARIDVFLADIGAEDQSPLLDQALERAHAYFDAGVDCVYPIALWQRDVLASFVADAGGPVNALAIPRAPSLAELAELGVARVSYGSLLQRQASEQLGRVLAAIAAEGR
jgi:2-methylisocitrate lyase-like PEP mutase family enzyme